MSKNIMDAANITVTRQQELDAIPPEYPGQIYVDRATLTISRRYALPPILFGASRVTLTGDAIAVARDKTIVEAFDRAKVCAFGESQVLAFDRAFAEGWNHTALSLFQNASGKTHDDARAEARENSVLKAYGHTFAIADH